MGSQRGGPRGLEAHGKPLVFLLGRVPLQARGSRGEAPTGEQGEWSRQPSDGARSMGAVGHHLLHGALWRFDHEHWPETLLSKTARLPQMQQQ